MEEYKMKKDAMKDEANQRTARKFLSFSFLFSTIFNHISDEEREEYHKLMNFYDEGCMFNIEINIEQKGSVYVDNRMMNVFYQEIRNRIPEGYCCMTGALIAHRMLLFITKDIGGNATKEFREELRKIAEDIGQLLIDLGSFSVRIGIGGWHPISDIRISYEESLRCVRYKSNSMVSMIEDIGEYLPGLQSFGETKKKFFSSISVGAEISVIYLTQILEQISVLNMDAQRNILLELVAQSVGEVFADYDEKEEDYVDFIRYADELSKIDNEEELRAWAYSKFKYISKVLRQKRVDRKGYIIKNAKQYLANHYQEDISLKDVADEAGMTPQYFSTLFKQATGKNFVEWLSEYRIKKAMYFLDQPGAVIKEVCFKVGYNDPNYFSRIFKKISGMTPKEYMNRSDV
jgi:two-component system response regulator YesN